MYFEFQGELEQLKKYFSEFKIVSTYNEITNVKANGVYVLNDEGSYIILILGGCPNFVQGSCNLEARCITAD